MGTVSATQPGTVSVSPSTTTTYTLTCTGAGGSATASATVTVTPTLTASCSVSPTSITAGGSATWTAAASGGTGVYTYSWSGTDSLTGSTQSVAKTYAAAGTKTATVTVTSGSQTKTQACANSLTVAAAAQPDLTAGSVTSGSATAGTPVTLSATVTNQGAASTGTGFTNLFQRATSAAGANTLDIGTYSRGTALTAGGSFVATRAHAFPSSGTWYVRACADKSSAASAGTIAESNEGNNCGPWTAISVAASGPVGTLSCTVSNSNPQVGDSVTYTASGATTPYTWVPSDGVGSYGTGATAQRTFTSTGSYGMQVTKTNYTSGNCPVVTAGPAACVNPSASITATPDRVREGDTTTLSWSASGVDSSCTITGPGVNQSVSGSSCTIPNGQATPTITQQSVYTISCDNGEFSDQVVVNLIPKFIEF